MILIYEKRDFADKITFWGKKKQFRSKTISDAPCSASADRGDLLPEKFSFPRDSFSFLLDIFHYLLRYFLLQTL